MKPSKRCCFCLIICALWISASLPAWAEEQIRIGIIGPMKFNYGREQWNGAQMAMQEINAAGGVRLGGKKIEIKLIKADSNEFFTIKAAAEAMEKLIVEEKCNFVIGGITSEATKVMQEVAMNHKTIFFSAGAAHPDLCKPVTDNYDRYKYFFRGTPFSSNYIFKNIRHQLRSVYLALEKQLGVSQARVALISEKAMWADAMVAEFKDMLPKMSMELIGTWRVEPTAKDLSEELQATALAKANIILAMINGPAGITLGRQYGELEIPAVVMGVITQAGTMNYFDATQGMGNYVMTSTTYTRGLEINELTKPFVESYFERYGELPQYTANTYSIIRYTLKQALEETQSLDPDKLIPSLEKGVVKSPVGYDAMAKNEEGRPTHDLVWGPNFSTGIAAQWQNGQLVAVWPHLKWASPYWEFSVEPPDTPSEISYKGLVPFKIAPWIAKAYQK